MPDRLELTRCGYEQCGVAYNTAVDVSKFTWKMFYTRSAAVLGASGYIVFRAPEFGWLAAALLVSGALATWFLTRRQMIANQNVIRKVVAAGLFLEKEHPELGCRFRLAALDDKLDEESTLGNIWKAPDDVAALRLCDLGLTPRLRELCTVHALIYLLFAVIAVIYWMDAPTRGAAACQ